MSATETDFTPWDQLPYIEQLRSTVWDAYKDAHGFRPRHLALNEMTEEQLKAELNQLSEVIRQQEAIRIEREQAAVVEFNNRVDNLIATGAGDRKTALRWIHEAEGSDGDDEYLCYLVGLPYGFFKTQAAVH